MLSLSASPQVSSTANVHEFCLIEGDVQVRSSANVAPGSAITAEKGASVCVDEAVRLLPGVVVEAIAGPQVTTGAGGEAYSAYVGTGSAIAHKSLIHSPAFIGKGCFVGFRSTVFNARLGDGCIVLAHALIQDVEIPPGRCVPAGAVINAQHQADQLPKVRAEDLAFVQEVLGMGHPFPGRVSSSSSSQTSSRSRLVSVHSAANSASNGTSNSRSNVRSNSSSTFKMASRAGRTSGQSSQFSSVTEGANMQAQRLSPDVVQQVRQYLAQGYRVGMEHADKRRYRSGVWETCTPIKDTREQAVFEGLERCLAEHAGEYVRMFGIDPKVKQRVGMVTVQRPGDKPTGSSGSRSSSGSGYGRAQAYSNGSGSSQSSGGLDSGVAQEVRNLLNAGYQIGTEHAGPRHYRSNVWKVCSPIESRNEREVFAKLEHCLDEHSGEYIRMFGINAQSKSRTATTTIQRADGKPVDVSARSVPAIGQSGGSSGSQSQSGGGYSQPSASGGGTVGDEAAQAVSQIIRSGGKVGIEFADKRRYRSGIWQTAPSISVSSESSAISKLQSFLSQNADKYVRIFSVNSQQKTRGSSTTIQKPGQPQSGQPGNVNKNGREAARDPINENPPHYDDPAFRGQPNGGQPGSLDNAVTNQITQLANQGLKLSLEFADKRRYRSGIWKTGPSISARRPAEAISEIGKQLARHGNDYVRLIATDTNAKRRVAELTVQRPGQKLAQSGNGSGGSASRHAPINASPSRGQSNSGNNGNGNMKSAVMDQVTQLVNQGHKISLEYADKRRYRSGIWKTGSAIAARRPAEAISELGKQLAQHQGEYVRLIGTDTEAKRRVLETTIQRP
ncbi:MAG: ribulose bisphosphate carboxylase small subunit [Cyanobacteria bacterium J06560_6]